MQGKVLVWLHTFLSNWTHQVSAYKAISTPTSVLSGAPQGSVLGLILFFVMISDLASNLRKDLTSLFADDWQVSAIIIYANDVHNAVYSLVQINKAVFNYHKFEHIHSGHKHENIPNYHDYHDHFISSKP